MRFNVQSKNVWIKDQYNPYYPNYVKILEVTPEGYHVQVQTAVGKDVNKGPKILLTEDQITDDIMGD